MKRRELGKAIHLWFGILFLAVAPIGVGLFSGTTPLALVVAVCGIAIVLTSKLEALSELSLGPIKAKMQATISEANATIGQLRELAATTATVVLSDLIAGHFMWGMSLTKRIELHDDLVARLQKLGVPKDQIDAARTEWWKGIGVAYHNKIGDNLHARATATGKDGQTVTMEFNVLANSKTRTCGHPDEYEALFKKYGLLDAETAGWIDDYRHFLKAREIRRPANSQTKTSEKEARPSSLLNFVGEPFDEILSPFARRCWTEINSNQYLAAMMWDVGGAVPFAGPGLARERWLFRKAFFLPYRSK